MRLELVSTIIDTLAADCELIGQQAVEGGHGQEVGGGQERESVRGGEDGGEKQSLLHPADGGLACLTYVFCAVHSPHIDGDLEELAGWRVDGEEYRLAELVAGRYRQVGDDDGCANEKYYGECQIVQVPETVV